MLSEAHQEAITQSEAATEARWAKRADHLVAQQGYGVAQGPLKITEKFATAVASAIKDRLQTVCRNHSRRSTSYHLRDFAHVVRGLDPVVSAAATLNAFMHAIAVGDTLRGAA